MQTQRSDLQKALHEKLSKGKKSSFSLRMTAMIDMIFLLLIFFLVTAKWRPPENFLPMNVSTAGAFEPVIGKAEPLIIRIEKVKDGCLVQVGRQETIQVRNSTIENDLALLLDSLKISLSAQKRYASDPVEIICAPGVKWDYVAKIYNTLYGAGLTDITFQMTEQSQDDSLE